MSNKDNFPIMKLGRPKILDPIEEIFFKKAMRELIRVELEKFLARGGKIKKLPPGKSCYNYFL